MLKELKKALKKTRIIVKRNGVECDLLRVTKDTMVLRNRKTGYLFTSQLPHTFDYYEVK